MARKVSKKHTPPGSVRSGGRGVSRVWGRKKHQEPTKKKPKKQKKKKLKPWQRDPPQDERGLFISKASAAAYKGHETRRRNALKEKRQALKAQREAVKRAAEDKKEKARERARKQPRYRGKFIKKRKLAAIKREELKRKKKQQAEERKKRAAEKRAETLRRKKERLLEKLRRIQQREKTGPSQAVRDMFTDPKWLSGTWHRYADGEEEGQIIVAAGPNTAIRNRIMALEHAVKTQLEEEPLWIEAGFKVRNTTSDLYQIIEGQKAAMLHSRRANVLDNKGQSSTAAMFFDLYYRLAENLRGADVKMDQIVIRATYGRRPKHKIGKTRRRKKRS